MAGRFDTNAAAHKSRAEVNTAGAAHSLEDWVLAIAPAGPGQNVLDLGCGRGKLVFPYARTVLPGGTVLGMDISDEAVAEVNQLAAAEGLDHVRAIMGNLDTIVEALAGQSFDLIVSSYAIYYAADMPALLGDLRGLLRAGGRVFVCGPGRGTNQEIIDLIGQAVDDPALPPPMTDFLDETALTQAGEAYAATEIHRLDNSVRFTSVEDVLGWWRRHNLFMPRADGGVERALREIFERRGEFRLTKNVLGVLFRA
jgi:ubiquinone/menaquinone biosynthesis C-methylase UbiE